MRTEIVIPNHATPSLNETLKFAFYKKTKLRKFYELCLMEATRNRHDGPVRLEIYRHCKGTLDEDNFVGGTKCLVDALKNRGIIIDDKPTVIQQRHFQQVKISPKSPKMTVVVIEDL